MSRQVRPRPSRCSREVTPPRRHEHPSPPIDGLVGRKVGISMRLLGSGVPTFRCLLALLVAAYPSITAAATATNPVCPAEAVQYNPGNGEDIIVPSGYTVSVFAQNLNFPTAVAFVGSSNRFKVYVLESGHGLPSRCNDENNPVFGGVTSPGNPMTPDILVFDQDGNKIAGPLGKPTATGGGFQ